jgi:hypothetical protein
MRGLWLAALLLTSCKCESDPHEEDGRCTMSFPSGEGTCHFTVQLVESVESRKFYIPTTESTLRVTVKVSVGEGSVRAELADEQDRTNHEVTAKNGAPATLIGVPYIGQKPINNPGDDKWYPIVLQAVGSPAKNVVLDIAFTTNLKPPQ